MNGMMVRNDITISLISCQFETSTVVIWGSLFVFISYWDGAEFKKEMFLILLQKMQSFAALLHPMNNESEHGDIF